MYTREKGGKKGERVEATRSKEGGKNRVTHLKTKRTSWAVIVSGLIYQKVRIIHTA